MSKTLKLPILVGPTGVGKSEVAYFLAKRMKAEEEILAKFRRETDIKLGLIPKVGVA